MKQKSPELIWLNLHKLQKDELTLIQETAGKQLKLARQTLNLSRVFLSEDPWLKTRFRKKGGYSQDKFKLVEKGDFGKGHSHFKMFMEIMAEFYNVPVYLFVDENLEQNRFSKLIKEGWRDRFSDAQKATPQGSDIFTIYDLISHGFNTEAPQSSTPINLAQAYGILKAIADRPDSRVEVKNGDVCVSGRIIPAQIHGFNDPDLEARIPLLALRLGLPSISPRMLLLAWGHALSLGDGLTHKDLVRAARQKATVQTESTVLMKWRDAMNTRLLTSNSQQIAAERFSKALKRLDKSEILELAPLLQDWPERLLTGRYWAYAEPPLPDLPPMPLKDVWVDIQLVDPLDMGSITFTDNLLQSVERRYEERKWLAEPAHFMLDRLLVSTVVIGAPGSGKTTLIKWLARRLITHADGRFLLPLIVPLRKYVLARQKEDDLLTFALLEAGVSDPDQIKLWKNMLAYLSGPEKNTVILMLDGYDEVPSELREALIGEINRFSYGYATVITSRPTAYPWALQAEQFCEISELSHESITYLINTWFKNAGRAEQAEQVQHHLEAHPDLQRISRNPFLLTLICGICFLSHQKSSLSIPSTRTGLYTEAIEQIMAHHSRRYPAAPFSTTRKRQVEQLALWLLKDAPEAPRYIFNERDVQECCRDDTFLPNVLSPSRLISQWDIRQETLHFLHKTFQEFLAARALNQQTKTVLADFIKSRRYDQSWQEVFRFLAVAEAEIGTLFWKQMRWLANHPDLFGLIFVQLAGYLVETGADDGGKMLLGKDLRADLWKHIVEGNPSNALVDAYIALDPKGYAERVKLFATKENTALQARLLRSLKRARSKDSSDVLVAKILSGDKNESAVSIYAIADVLDARGCRRLIQAASDLTIAANVRKRVIRALGHAHTYEAVDLLAQIAENENDLFVDALYALGYIGSERAAAALCHLLAKTQDAVKRGYILSALSDTRTASARNMLMAELASYALDDPQIKNTLEALNEFPVPKDAGVIITFLGHPDESVREAAAWALMEATESGVTEALAQAGREDEAGIVRVAALAAMRKRARPNDIKWLEQRVKDESKPPLERNNALEAVLMAAAHFSVYADGPWISATARELVQTILETVQPDLTYTAASRSYLLGPEIGVQLMKICQNERYPHSVREAACLSLGKIKHKPAVKMLLAIVRSESDVPYDEAEPVVNPEQRVARAAAEALTRIDPKCLLEEPGQTAMNALADYSLKTGFLVFKHAILDSRGNRL